MHRKNFRVYSIVLTMGLLVGSLVGELLARWLPAGVARDFFTTSVAGAFGPVADQGQRPGQIADAGQCAGEEEVAGGLVARAHHRHRDQADGSLL